ncbi:DUF4126 domain-containing protein [Sphingomonas sp. RB3P16]|uniref:DUF4126 domain-containing protein n=1 Tax=Parasphingomonas frigoris TaxID=3096163 RepID=UPI002FCBAC1D
MVLLLALFIGMVAGLRSMTAPAIVSWAANVGVFPVEGTWLAFMGSLWASWLLTLAAAVELVTDQLPSTPSRTVPMQFGARIFSGALCGATVSVHSSELVIGAVCGAVGAVIGTLGGAAFRGWLATRLKSGRHAAIIEDIVAIGGGVVIVACL